MEVSVQLRTLDALPLPLQRISSRTGNRTPVVQPVASSLYLTDLAAMATLVGVGPELMLLPFTWVDIPKKEAEVPPETSVIFTTLTHCYTTSSV